MIPPEVARRMVRGMDAVREFRRRQSDSYNFNWLLSIQPQFQQPFEVTHASMRALELRRGQPAHELAANLRRAFSGIVTGNVKEYGIQAIEREGPYELSGDPRSCSCSMSCSPRSSRRGACTCPAASIARFTGWSLNSCVARGRAQLHNVSAGRTLCTPSARAVSQRRQGA